MKNQFRIENLPDPISIREPPSMFCVDKKFNIANEIKNTAHVEFNDKNHEHVRFVKVNSMPAVGEHFTKKYMLIKLILLG